MFFSIFDEGIKNRGSDRRAKEKQDQKLRERISHLKAPSARMKNKNAGQVQNAEVKTNNERELRRTGHGERLHFLSNNNRAGVGRRGRITNYAPA